MALAAGRFLSPPPLFSGQRNTVDGDLGQTGLSEIALFSLWYRPVTPILNVCLFHSLP